MERSSDQRGFKQCLALASLVGLEALCDNLLHCGAAEHRSAEVPRCRRVRVSSRVRFQMHVEGEDHGCSPSEDGVERRTAGRGPSPGVTGAAAHARWSRGAAKDDAAAFSQCRSTCLGGSFGGSTSASAASLSPHEAAATADARRLRTRPPLLACPLAAALPPVRAWRSAAADHKPRAFRSLTCMTCVSKALHFHLNWKNAQRCP